jgi:type IV fimbrial biogenesis protein FimT
VHRFFFIGLLELTMKQKLRGFSLIELMVTITIAAVLMLVVIPGLSTYQRSFQLDSFTSNMLATMNAARGEAMKRGRYAMLTPIDTVNWSSGWVVFVDTDRTQDYSGNTDYTIRKSDVPPSYLTITANGTAAAAAPYIMFDPAGYSKTKNSGFGALTFTVARNDVSSSDVSSQTRRLIISNTGRVRSCTPSSDSTCTATALQ